MAMSVEQAFELQALDSALRKLRDATHDCTERHNIQAQLDRIEPRLDEAEDITIQDTDNDFQAIADEAKSKVKFLNDAIENINKISSALTRAAKMIDTIVAAVA
jgi:SMC interacting uncharacterized protein involved in chromosome segregation